jgi:hypothetical protein
MTVKKRGSFEAVLLTQEIALGHLLDGGKLPAGVELSSASYHPERRVVYDAMFHTSFPESAPVRIGDWIVTDECGTISVCSPEVFARDYEAAE